ncbi:MAG: hypothetical protein PHD01_05710 [Geobacteraceae bacterium]|nr:hypothetical protein [Geobacteraceae bacterium]
MDSIKRFIECYVPVTSCDLRCNYCYVMQQNRRNTHPVVFGYAPEQIGLAFSKERWGGICFFSLTGAGETLIPRQIIDIAKLILSHGHYVNITTNGTLSKRFEQITSFPQSLLERLHFSFSFHYLELLKASKIDIFFDNVLKIKRAGCSFLVQINLCDEYIPHLDKIRSLCMERIGAPPQVAVTREQDTGKICLKTHQTKDEYIRAGNSFGSPLFDFGIKNFLVKRKEFCYAGDWTFKLYLGTGVLKSCYDSGLTQNIFIDPKKPIRFRAVGVNCRSPYCVNSTHFMSLGVIPELETPSYADLRNRPDANWYSPKMQTFLNGKLCEANLKYSRTKMILVNIAGYLTRIKLRISTMSLKFIK